MIKNTKPKHSSPNLSSLFFSPLLPSLMAMRTMNQYPLQSVRPLLSLINSKRNHHNSTDWESFRTKSAYEVLGVSQSSSFSEIKSSFRKLAKETHPDMATNSDCYNNNGYFVGNRNSDSNNRFLQILAAYEILSDSKKRAHYDSFLYSQIKIKPKSDYKTYNSCSNPSITLTKESNVVEWLKWYRLTIDDIITHKRISNNSTYLEKLESELYTAIRSAYFGPQIESMNFLPDCFEAEERSSLETPELLHLVSGRDLFGIVYVGNNNNNNVPKLPHTYEDNSIILENEKNVDICENSDLELHICGKAVATANRKNKCDCMNTCTNTGTEIEDHIHVFLVPDELDGNGKRRERFLLGVISGLESSGEEGLCTVFDARGVKTHVIIKHRTLLVKHMHWYQVGNEVSICECMSRRARLPPSRYWLFEPRCYMHDIGGWYVETFGRDTKGKNVLSPRQWDSFPELTEKRLHPAMYLMALAYRSLDLEEAKRRKWSVPKFDFVDNWYKRYFKWG